MEVTANVPARYTCFFAHGSCCFCVAAPNTAHAIEGYSWPATAEGLQQANAFAYAQNQAHGLPTQF